MATQGNGLHELHDKLTQHMREMAVDNHAYTPEDVRAVALLDIALSLRELNTNISSVQMALDGIYTMLHNKS